MAEAPPPRSPLAALADTLPAAAAAGAEDVAHAGAEGVALAERGPHMRLALRLEPAAAGARDHRLARVRVFKDKASGGQRVEGRGLDLGIAVAAQRIHALLIREDVKEVGGVHGRPSRLARERGVSSK